MVVFYLLFDLSVHFFSPLMKVITNTNIPVFLITFINGFGAYWQD